MHHPVHKTLKAAYSFYNVSTVTNWVDLMGDALVSAKNVSTGLLGIRRPPHHGY
jgi:glycylpeptide N-tetradecanoyltransferase